MNVVARGSRNRNRSAKRWLVISYVLWVACLPLPGCSAAHDGWAPAAKPVPMLFMILGSLMSTPKLATQLEGFDLLFSLANWAFLLSLVCFAGEPMKRPWLPLAIAVLLPGYCVFGLKRLLGAGADMTLYFGYYAMGVPYLLAAFGCLRLGCSRPSIFNNKHEGIANH
jgi:hypothetical protein